LIDNVVIIDRVFTDTEIAALYNGGSGTEGCEGIYVYDNSSSSSSVDSSSSTSSSSSSVDSSSSIDSSSSSSSSHSSSSSSLDSSSSSSSLDSSSSSSESSSSSSSSSLDSSSSSSSSSSLDSSSSSSSSSSSADDCAYRYCFEDASYPALSGTYTKTAFMYNGKSYYEGPGYLFWDLEAPSWYVGNSLGDTFLGQQPSGTRCPDGSDYSGGGTMTEGPC